MCHCHSILAAFSDNRFSKEENNGHMLIVATSDNVWSLSVVEVNLRV